MNLTSVDPPDVIRFVRKQYPEVEMIKPNASIYQVAVKKGLLPTQRVRWCCNEYKENAGAGKVTLIGIRHQESTRRAKRNEVEISAKKFSGTLEGFEQYREAKINNSRKSRPAKGTNITNATEERTIGCISGKESLLISPIIHWTERDVWEFLNRVCQVPHCCLYDEGYRRIGCICCPMSSHQQKIREINRWPHVKRNWIKAIIEIRRCNVGGGQLQERYMASRKRPTVGMAAQSGDSASARRSTRQTVFGNGATKGNIHTANWLGGSIHRTPKSATLDRRVFGKLLACRLDRGARTRNSREYLRLVDKRQIIQKVVCR